LIEQALRKGRTVDTDQRVILETELSQLKTDEARRLSDIAVSEHERRTNIDIQARWEQIVQDLDAADLLEISEQQLLKKLRNNLTELYREQHQIKQGDDPPSVKKKILARYNKDIAHLERLIDARQAGLLSSEDRQEARRLAAGASEGRADSSEET
jgi:hypothetical protein